MKVTILGGGMIGGAMAFDLNQSENLQVQVVDKSEEVLNRLKAKGISQVTQADVTDTNRLKEVVADSDLVIGAVPGFMGYSTLKQLILLKKNVVDISFFSEDPFTLDSLAKSNDVTVVVDCGVAPGLSNMLVGKSVSFLDSLEKVLIYVGGLPVERRWPYEYKAPFSPIDVIEEYTRPARFVEFGQIVEKPALSDPEYLDFPEIGTLEAFNTDGLRTLIKTIEASFLKEKTLRYPGHIEKIRILRETGFFSKTPVAINGTQITPLELTSKLLFPKWKLVDDEEDLTVLQVLVTGRKDGKSVSMRFDMLDRFDPETRLTSMARTTGFTATATARLMLSRPDCCPKGIVPPEKIGMNPEQIAFVQSRLEERNIFVNEIVEEMVE